MNDAPLIVQGFRFRLDPTMEQERFLAACAGASRYWFNQGLALVKQRLDERRGGAEVDVPWSYRGLCVAFRGNAIKDELAPWRAEVVTGSYQAGLEALGKALQNYLRGRKSGRNVGFPRFRAKGRCHEAIVFQRPRLTDSRHVTLDRRLGPLRTKESLRKLIRLLATDPHARVLRSTVRRVNGGWAISCTVQRAAKFRHARCPAAAVGVDLGLASLATLSTGHAVANSRPLEAELDRLRRLQRQLDRQRRANNAGCYDSHGRPRTGCRRLTKSRRMLRTEQRIAKLHARVANLRREQAHRLTTSLVREFGVIGVESLAVKNLLANRRLSRRIHDVAWGMVLSQLRYKTSWSANSILVAADRFFPSSKTCSACGAVRAKLCLADRVFACGQDGCGNVMDRDLNAAVNLAQWAQQRAQAEGHSTYVARTGRFTEITRGGQVSLVELNERSPMRRGASSDASPRGDALALA